MLPVNFVTLTLCLTFTQQKLLRTEQAKGGRLISSIESLDFSVTCKEDVEVSIKDSDGWKLESGCAMVLCAFLFCNTDTVPYKLLSMGRKSFVFFLNCKLKFCFHV